MMRQSVYDASLVLGVAAGFASLAAGGGATSLGGAGAPLSSPETLDGR